MSARYNVLVYGGGAVGSIFGWRVAQCRNAAVSMICRSNYDQVKETGYFIQTSTGRIAHFQPRRVYRAGFESYIEPTQHFDYVICTHKITEEPHSISRNFKPLIGPETTIVTAQNGMGVELPFRRAFPRNTILSAVCNLGCNQLYPGFVQQTARINSKPISIGIHSPSTMGSDIDRKRLHALVAMDDEFQIASNIRQERWFKLIFNGAWNTTTALTGLNTHEVLQRPDAVELVRQLAQEAYNVAVESGMNLDEDTPARIVELAKSSAAITPSTLQDVRKRRPMELGPIFGYLVSQARKVGVYAPYLEATYDLLRQENERIKRQRESPEPLLSIPGEHSFSRKSISALVSSQA